MGAEDAATAVLEVHVLGAPKRAQLVLRMGTSRHHIIRTTDEGRAVARGLVPGTYVATFQRARRKATAPRELQLVEGVQRLVLGAHEAL